MVDVADQLIIGICTPGSLSLYNASLCDSIRATDVNGKPYALHTIDLTNGDLTATDYGLAVSLMGSALQTSRSSAPATTVPGRPVTAHALNATRVARGTGVNGAARSCGHRERCGG